MPNPSYFGFAEFCCICVDGKLSDVILTELMKFNEYDTTIVTVRFVICTDWISDICSGWIVAMRIRICKR